ncbi:DUF7527 domain-containing protein [Halorubellus litoreus]|uniref:Transcriptional regulator n=1 Tax=Halorubellus litoreus TaxID=755308 RepID=A0ABD5VI81_9EURY
MDSRTEARVKDWDSRPFSDGYEDLRELADAEFSGAVETGSTTAFVLNGKVVGVVGGDVESFDGASGTIYEAPHPSLPLLFAMREQGGEERAKYYTNDTPISEADGTLSSGSFTGYVELSENVLSGDYYVVYYGGRSMSCAFVGNQEKLITDDEAFDRADDEVGIYTVWDVDIEVQDIPADEEPDDDAAAGAGAGSAGGGAVADAGTGGAGSGADTDAGVGGVGAGAGGGGSPDERVDDTPAAAAEDPSTAVGDDEVAGRESTGGGAEDAVAAPPIDDAEPTVDEDPVVGEAEPASDPTPRRGERDDERRSERPVDDGDAVTRDESAGSDDAPSTTGRRARSETETSSGRNAPGRTAAETPDSTSESDARAVPSDDSTGGAMAEVPDEVMAEVEDEARASEVDDEVAWRETTTIPSINPDRTVEDDDPDPLAAGTSEPTGTTSDARSTTDRDPGPPNSRSSRTDDHATGRQGANGNRGASPNGAAAGGADPDRVTELSEELESVREERDRIAAERNDLEAERDRLAERNDELQARVDDLEDEVAALESDLAAARERLEAETPGEDVVELSPREALEGTNLFVRYGSKSATTLEDVHDSDVGIADLEANLRLEYHTSFDAENAVIDGKAYDEFLYESTPYQFVEWFVYDLVFEIRDTGNENDLGDLYEAFPKVDRVELYGDVSLRYEEDGEEHREQTTFDVVVRDRMGNPLAVANVNASRDPATEEMMVDLQERGTRVKRTSDALAGAFMVTASFFAPEALEIANEATSGGILSRDSKKSYVKLSRKRGYHLCLVETRNGEFHVNVPEL